MIRGLWRSLLAAALLVAFTASAHAQGMGSIFGKVTDASGAVMPGVTVTVAGTGLQQPLVAVTTDTGAYQFPSVPIGTYTVTFELQGFKRAVRSEIVLVAGQNASINQGLEIGAMTEELVVSGMAPVVDVKKTTTGAVFDANILQKIPTARDPWQIINMTPGVQAGLNVGGSSSGQQVGLSSRGTGANVQWNLEGGNITDLASNSSPSYFNFDSFEQIQVVNGGGDVSIQSSGLSINLITKSGSNIYKGSVVGTFENDKMQAQNVTQDLFDRGTGGFLSGAPITRITNVSGEFGGPILRNKLWFWASADHQDINAGVVNFFDGDAGGRCADLASAQRLGTSLGITFDEIDTVAGCLKNDKTVIKNLGAKINYQLNSAHKFQYLFQSDNKVRNARGAGANTGPNAVTQQYSDTPWGFPLPQHSLTHTWVATDRLVFNNMLTYVHGGFFLDYQDYKTCGDSRYLGSMSSDGPTDPSAYITGARAGADCLWNQQAMHIRTTSFNERSLVGTYQTQRPSTELKSDGTYFASGVLGGDHSLKFGVGYRHNPILSFEHYSGGARALVQCNGNRRANCGDGAFVAPGSSDAGLVPWRAVLYRDQLRNSDWWSYNAYIQDSFSRGRWRLNGGLRWDWQQSKHLGGCVPANVIRPDLLPAQCEEATQSGINPNTGETETIQPFSNLSPRLSVTYDLFGNGKTALKVSGGYYYQTKITLADSLNGMATTTALTWGDNRTNGTCVNDCWNDANRDGFVQANELSGTPSSSNSRFDVATGVLRPAGNIVSEDAELARTREVVAGVQHELISNLAVGVDYIYRNYDKGTQSFPLGYQPGASGYPLSNLYVGPLTYTDPITGLSAPYFVICDTCRRPSGVGNITVTSPDHRVYQGVDLTLSKRYSNRWQANVAVTLQTNPSYPVLDSNPTGFEFSHGISTLPGYLVKANGSYDLPWGVTAAGNFIMNQGNYRIMVIDGPQNVFGGVGQGTIDYDTLQFRPVDQNDRFEAVKLLDLSLQKTFSLGQERYRLKVMLDAFNVLNSNVIFDYDTNNLSNEEVNLVEDIVPPRVFRFGVTFNF
ncbi:MAG: carboxypeptidase regulatory-like domain-containing protein [Vicinamibacterales bacterium]